MRYSSAITLFGLSTYQSKEHVRDLIAVNYTTKLVFFDHLNKGVFFVEII